MKKYLLLSYVIILWAQSVFPQSINNRPYSKPEQEQIAEIDKSKQEIKSNLIRCKETIKFKNKTNYTAVYRKHNNLQFIKEYWIDQNQNIDYVKNWYFHDGDLIYCEQVCTERVSGKTIDVIKFYFVHEHLFYWIQSGKIIDVNSQLFKRAGETFPEYIEKLRMENIQ